MPPDSLDDDEPKGATNSVRTALIVLRAQAGDESAFAELMRLYGDSTLRYLSGLVGDSADDVFQETWIAVYRQLATLHDPSAFTVWLYRSARHRALNWLRRHRRERELLVDVPLEAIPANEGGGTDTLDGIDASRLEVAMREMPPPQREVLLLRFRDDLSYAEIARITSVPLGTVRARLHYAKKRLAALLTSGEHNARSR